MLLYTFHSFFLDFTVAFTFFDIFDHFFGAVMSPSTFFLKKKKYEKYLRRMTTTVLSVLMHRNFCTNWSRQRKKKSCFADFFIGILHQPYLLFIHLLLLSPSSFFLLQFQDFISFFLLFFFFPFFEQGKHFRQKLVL